MIIYYLIEFIILDYSNTDSASESDISTVVTKEIIDVETKSETNLFKSTIFNYKYEINKLEKNYMPTKNNCYVKINESKNTFKIIPYEKKNST